MAGPRAVLFDLDGTLLDFGDAAWQRTVAHVCAGLAAAAPGLDAALVAATYERQCLDLWQGAETSVLRAPSGAVDGRAVWWETWQGALTACGWQDAGLVDLAVERYRAERMRRYRLYDDVTAAVARIRRRTGALAVVTNGPADTQVEKMAATGLDAMVDVVVTSGELRVAKPDPRIFHAAVQRLGVPPREAWHVGDSLVCDVAGARRAELGAAVWINRTEASGAPAATHTVTSLTELADLLDG